MNMIKLLQRVGIDILKGTVAALALFLGLMIGGLVAGLLHLPSPSMPANTSLTALLPLMLISGISIAIVLGECFQRLNWSFWPRLLAIGMCNYLLYYLLNLLDGLLFSPLPHMTTGIISDLFPAMSTAAVIAGLWRPKKAAMPVWKIISTFFSTRPWSGWAWRLVVAWLVFPPIYYLFGRIVALFTLHYYEDPTLNLGLTLPALSTLMLMQIVRGALFLLAVAPILVAWQGSRRSLWWWVCSVIFIQIANQIIVQAYWLPLGLRIPHAIELLVDSFAQAGFYVWLLFLLPAGSAQPVLKQKSTVTAEGQSVLAR